MLTIENQWSLIRVKCDKNLRKSSEYSYPVNIQLNIQFILLFVIRDLRHILFDVHEALVAIDFSFVHV